MLRRVKFNYEPGPDRELRPYLWLNLRADRGPSFKVKGLLDSGADVTVLDLDFAQALGIEPAALEQVVMHGPSGALSAQRSKLTVEASLPGAPRPAAPLRPIFVSGATGARWGRDFMLTYAVAFDEKARQFSLFGAPAESSDPHDRA